MAVKAFYLRNIERFGENDIVHWLQLDCHVLKVSPPRIGRRGRMKNLPVRRFAFSLPLCLLIRSASSDSTKVLAEARKVRTKTEEAVDF
jgi:hypothetical protein